MTVKVPNLGDGISSAVVVGINVSIGDEVDKEQTLLELETDKAVAPLPSPDKGVIENIQVKEGDKVAEGQVVITLKGSNGAGSAPAATETASAQPTQQVQPFQPIQPVQPLQPIQQQQVAIPNAITPGVYQSPSGASIPASPSIRKAARSFGIDLTRVQGTGRGGRIERQDVFNYIQTVQALAFQNQQSPQGQPAPAPAQAPQKPPKPQIDFSKWGKVKKEAMTPLREKIGEKMTDNWQSIPHVTQFDDADITDLWDIRKKYNPKYKKNNQNLTLTIFALKAAVNSLKKFPIFNSSLDETTNEVVYKEYYHIGVAVDTPSGLIVPVIRDVDKKSMFELAEELTVLAQKARDRKLTVDELQGGTFTISNLGGLGASNFTPIINSPEVAILALSKGLMKPVYDGKEFKPRLMMPMGLSYDHRVIDGADGARFIRDLCAEFEQFKETLVKESCPK